MHGPFFVFSNAPRNHVRRKSVKYKFSVEDQVVFGKPGLQILMGNRRQIKILMGH